MADDQTMSLMQCYLDSILEANKVTNLTRITDREQARGSPASLLRLRQEERPFSLIR